MRVVWNLTNFCNYNCKICGVNAETTDANTINNSNHFFNEQISNGKELSLNYKKKILSNIFTYPINEIDFSGGDPLIFNDNIEIIKMASKILNKKNISISTTGSSLNKLNIFDLYKFTNVIDLTIDWPPNFPITHRQNDYNLMNIDWVSFLVKKGLHVNIECPIGPYHKIRILKSLANLLFKIKPMTIEIMRIMPVGRIYNNKKYFNFDPKKIIDYFLYYLYDVYKLNNIMFHCALKGIYTKSEKACNMLIEKIGVDCFGRVFACAWSANLLVNINNNPFYLGNLLDESLSDILKRRPASLLSSNSIENNQECKIILFLQANKLL